MYFKIYVIVLTLCILCLVILTHLQSIGFSCYRNPPGINLFNASADFQTGLPAVGLGLWTNSTDSGRLSTNSTQLSTMGDRRSSSSSRGSKKNSIGTSGDGMDVGDGTFSGHFDIIKLNNHLKKCVRESDKEIDMDEYIFTFQQLYKFFCLLGTVFGFVGSDVKSKLEILQDYRHGENKIHYETVEKMLEFEKSSDYINTNKESSGSRTLLRLHRALNFVSKFLAKVDTIADTDGTYHICKDAYYQTLSKFHPWLIQKGAGLAMMALPLKKDLISKVCDGRIETAEVGRLLIQVIDSTQTIYDQCERAYKENDLLGLP